MTSKDHRVSVLDTCSYSPRYGGFALTHDSSNTYSKTVRYVNNTKQEVDVKERSGVVVALASNPYQQTRVESIEIEVEWRMTNKCFMETADRLAQGHPGDPLLKVVIEAFDNRNKRGGKETETSSLALSISFPLEDLRKAGGSVYLEELDITLGMPIMPGSRKINHPFEPRERVKKSFASSVPFVTNETFLFSMKAINNDQVAKNHDRFMLLGNQVYRVPVERDPHNENGIHIVRRRNADSDPPDTGTVVEEHMTFEEADKRFRLYDTVEMARKMGDPEVHFKLELAEMSRAQKIEEIAQKRVDAEDAAVITARRLDLERERLEMATAKAREDLAKDRVRNFGDWVGLCGKFLLVALGALTSLAKLSTLKPV